MLGQKPVANELPCPRIESQLQFSLQSKAGSTVVVNRTIDYPVSLPEGGYRVDGGQLGCRDYSSQGVDVAANGLTSEPYGFDERCPGTEHWVKNEVARVRELPYHELRQLRRKLRGKGMPGVRSVAAVRAVEIQVSTQCCTRRVKTAASVVNLKVGVAAEVDKTQRNLQAVTSFSASAISLRARVAVSGMYESSVRSSVVGQFLANSSGMAV